MNIQRNKVTEINNSILVEIDFKFETIEVIGNSEIHRKKSNEIDRQQRTIDLYRLVRNV